MAQWRADGIKKEGLKMYYHTCPHCGSNLDPSEKCDCRNALYGKGALPIKENGKEEHSRDHKKAS